MADTAAATAGASPWRDAFAAVERSNDFALLSLLLESSSGEVAGINESFDFEGNFFTPLFAAVVLGLEDLVPQLCARGADPCAPCFYEGFLCGPLHAAALRLDVLSLRHLLEVLGPAGSAASLAETSVVSKGVGSADFVGVNAVHVLVLRDVWSEEVYRLLMGFGIPLSVACRTRQGEAVCGLELPKMLGNKAATAQMLDLVVGEEVKYMICSTRLAHQLNAFLELSSALKRNHDLKVYRCTADVDFNLSGTPSQPRLGEAEVPSTAMLFAADRGNSDALRLLLYSGADLARTAQFVLPFDSQRDISLAAGAVQLALLRGHLDVVENLLLFGVDPQVACSGQLHRSSGGATGIDVGDVQERWEGLSLVHLAILARNPDVVPELLKREGTLDAVATRAVAGSEGSPEEFSPLRLAVLLSEVRCTATLLDCGAHVSEIIRADACSNEAVCEMFGGPSVVGFQDWVSALLTGDTALQALIDRRTDLARVLTWPEGGFLPLLEQHRLASPELVAQLQKALGELPTALHDVRPVHLAALLQQPWAVKLLADAGAPVAAAAPVREMPHADAGHSEESGLSSMPLDMVFLAVRLGGLQVLEMLCADKRFAMSLDTEIPISPDITPPFFPRRETQLGPTWAWMRLGPLELAILHRRVDMAVLLVRLGANLLHTVDHVSIHPPSHYSVTDMCFRGLTPLHLCALLNLSAAAAALLNEACQDGGQVVADEYLRAQRQAMLSATCSQGWATVESDGCPDKEQWLWRDLTPLHLAILQKHYDMAELLIDLSSAETLAKLCLSKDVSGDSERSFSALLLAFEQNQKDLHRRIARRSPIC
mmetsp:Transcript_92814/g.250418  ORF Transcript_92814/g.250418 Transcript_92814/m.250418 type:complete len:826 (-) Transcript_92814:34-2511(-)